MTPGVVQGPLRLMLLAIQLRALSAQRAPRAPLPRHTPGQKGAA